LSVCREYEGPIDLMIADVVMPEMGGRETAERLQPRYPGMKVVFMSGYPENKAGDHDLMGPDLNLIPKPFSRQIWLERLQRRCRLSTQNR